MAIQISALVESESRGRKNVHWAAWTAQLVLGVRALRCLVDAESSLHEDERPPLRLPYREPRALPRGGEPPPSHHANHG